MGTLMSQLDDLREPFADAVIQKAPQGKYGEYVKHSVVVERLLEAVGPYSFEIVEVIRAADGHVEGCLASLTAEVDGRRVTITEVGDCENPTNWKTDGARLKDAASDAVKRCAMRLGVGLHLWSQDLHGLDTDAHGPAMIPVAAAKRGIMDATSKYAAATAWETMKYPTTTTSISQEDYDKIEALAREIEIGAEPFLDDGPPPAVVDPSSGAEHSPAPPPAVPDEDPLPTITTGYLHPSGETHPWPAGKVTGAWKVAELGAFIASQGCEVPDGKSARFTRATELMDASF